MEGGTHANLGVEPDVAPHPAHQLAGDRQPEAGTALLALVGCIRLRELLEDAGMEMRGNALAMVDDIESDLERNWEASKANSRLAWNEARGAVRDGWHHIERNLPGDFDRDGR